MFPNRIIPVLLLAMLLTAGCRTSNLEKIHGEWQCDAKATVAAFNGTAKNIPGAADLAAGMLENIKFLFHAESKKLTRSFGPVADVVAFSVISDSGNQIVLRLEKDEMIITLRDENTIMVAMERNGEKMIFTRIKK